MCRIFLISVTLLAISLTSSCNKCNDVTNPECDNYDYCATFEDLSADFEAFIEVRGDLGVERPVIKHYIGDTSIHSQFLLRGLDESATDFTWTTLGDPRALEGREVELAFEGTGLAYINLEVRRESNRCPNLNEETAISTRGITLIDPLVNPIEYLDQEYLGYNLSGPDSLFTIEFYYNSLSSSPRTQIKNLPRNTKQTISLKDLGFRPDWNSFTIPPDLEICCQRAQGYGEFSNGRREVRIEYSYVDRNTGLTEERVFVGERVE